MRISSNSRSRACSCALIQRVRELSADERSWGPLRSGELAVREEAQDRTVPPCLSTGAVHVVCVRFGMGIRKRYREPVQPRAGDFHDMAPSRPRRLPEPPACKTRPDELRRPREVRLSVRRRPGGRRADMKDLLGGKGANLAEMASLGLPVPPGFTITTEVCTAYYPNGGALPDGLEGRGRSGAGPRSARRSGATFGDVGHAAARVRALGRARLDARHDGHDPQPRPQRRDREGPGRASPATRALPTTAIAASSRCTPTSCSASITACSRTSSTTSRT